MEDKVCCNCGNCERRPERGSIETYCAIDNHRIGYVECFPGCGAEMDMSAEWCAMMSVFNSIGSYDRLRELADAEKEGRVAVLPCRVGDTVYFVSKRYKCINELTINSVESIVLLGKKWGKCVFVSREEAEKALEAAKQNG